jgi:hypothetical protein
VIERFPSAKCLKSLAETKETSSFDLRSLSDERIPFLCGVSSASFYLPLFRQQAWNDSRWNCPLRLLYLLLTLLVDAFIAALPAQAQQGLNNSDIIKM